MRSPVLSIVVLSCLALTARTTYAQSFTLVYDLAGQPGNQASQAPTPASVPADLDAGSLQRGAGVNAASGTNGFAASAFTTGALASDDYFSLMVNPLNARTLTLTTLTFSERRSLTGIRDFALRSSLDNFGTDLLQVNVPDDSLTRRHTYSFSGSFANLLGPVELRLYGYRAESGAGTWRLGVNATSGDNPGGFPADLRLAGMLGNRVSANAPEPASLPLFVVGIAGLASVLRRRIMA